MNMDEEHEWVPIKLPGETFDPIDQWHAIKDFGNDSLKKIKIVDNGDALNVELYIFP